MMQRVLSVFMIVAVLSTQPSLGLVEPSPSNLPPQPWMAQIFVSSGSSLKEYCKGALIDAQWILTSGYCALDPFEAIDRSGTSMPTLVVRFAGSSELHEIEKFVQSPDLAVGMMKLKSRVDIQSVTLGAQSSSELLYQNVFILGTETSRLVRDNNYNPGVGDQLFCTVRGILYNPSGAACYILVQPVASSVLQETRGHVIDPNWPDAPKGWIDTVSPFDTGGSRIYLDFREDASYPCHEDLGAPVLRTNEFGDLEVVAVVSGVGMTVGMPMCGPALRNRFATASWYREWIDTTIAQEGFTALCPETPALQVEYPGDSKVRVSWSAVSGATGYRLFYTDRAGYTPYVTLDLGNRTDVSTTISPGLIYSVGIVAYNGTCTSPVSEETTVAL